MVSKVDGFSVFRRLFFLYSLILVVIYLVLVAVFVGNINKSSRELVTSRQMMNENYLENIEQQLDNIYEQQVNLINNANVTKLSYSIYDDAYEKNQMILELLRTIEGIQSMNPLIEDIIITFPRLNITLSSDEGYFRKNSDVWSHVKPGSEYNYLIAYDDNILLNFTYPLMFSVSEGYTPDCNIQVVLSQALLRQSLDVFVDEQGSGGALWFMLEDDFVIESGSSEVSSLYINASEAEHLSSTSNEWEGKYEGYQFVTTKSMKYPLTIIAFINRELISQIMLRYIAILTAVMVIISGMFAFSLLYSKRIVVKPIQEMISAFGRISEGDFSVRIYHEPHDEFNYLYSGFNDSVGYIQELIENIYEQENLLQNAELAQLQSQINPHFLYNSFFIINRMAKNESYDQITTFVTSLAKYYRFLNKETSQFIPLEEEVNHMTNYIDIQQMRFSEKISAELGDVPEQMSSVKVPKLILQPIVENAYKYGMADKLEDGLIRVSYEQEGSIIRIIVEDNGEEINESNIKAIRRGIAGESEDGKIHALQNINKRLKLAYGEHCGVIVEVGDFGGLCVVLIIDTTVQL